MDNVSRLIAPPHVRTLGEGRNFWSVYRTVVGDSPVRGNLVPDAHIAALMRQNGIATIWTADRDFRRFDHIDAQDPFTA